MVFLPSRYATTHRLCSRCCNKFVSRPTRLRLWRPWLLFSSSFATKAWSCCIASTASQKDGCWFPTSCWNQLCQLSLCYSYVAHWAESPRTRSTYRKGIVVQCNESVELFKRFQGVGLFFDWRPRMSCRSTQVDHAEHLRVRHPALAIASTARLLILDRVHAGKPRHHYWLFEQVFAIAV